MSAGSLTADFVVPLPGAVMCITPASPGRHCNSGSAYLANGHPRWSSRIILLLEVIADLGCFWIARHKISAVKNTGSWFAGRRQVVATDTS